MLIIESSLNFLLKLIQLLLNRLCIPSFGALNQQQSKKNQKRHSCFDDAPPCFGKVKQPTRQKERENENKSANEYPLCGPCLRIEVSCLFGDFGSLAIHN